MKRELTTTIYKKVFGYDEDHQNVNKLVKAVIINFGDERGDIIGIHTYEIDPKVGYTHE